MTERMPQTTRIGRLWLVLVIVLFCLPLFVHLGQRDLDNDEAIYSFSVARVIEIGDWLVPKSSPTENFAFLEKPPLKVWIVAAPIRLGILPLNEFSLRVWDALFGGVAFLYVFGIGSMLAGPVCGITSVLVLFTYGPLVFEHGLRNNDMEAALFLSYCGGIYHYFRWTDLGDDRRRRYHVVAVGLYFVLGFMTKFVAVLFLPLVLGIASVCVRQYRRQLIRDWSVWAGTIGLSLALIVPWFAYASWRFGAYFWQIIVGLHVYTRFTSYVDRAHVQPWNYYFTSLYASLFYSGARFAVLGGAILLCMDIIRRRSPKGAIIIVWFLVPMALISLGTSKLMHYAYPFIPPIALTAGYLAAYLQRVAPGPLNRALWGTHEHATRDVASPLAAFRRPIVRGIVLTLGAAAGVVAVATFVDGPIRLGFGTLVFLRNQSVIRPALIAAVCTVLAGESRRATQAIVPLLILVLLPTSAYVPTLEHLSDGEHPMRTARDCLMRVESEVEGTVRRGLYVDIPSEAMWHPIYYYFRTVRPWQRTEREDPPSFQRYIEDPNQWRPVLIWDPHYQSVVRRLDPTDSLAAFTLPKITLNDMQIVLPGPYAACTTTSVVRRPSD